MTTKTYHGCTCLKDWVKIDGKKYSGCVYGKAGSASCPMTTDKKTLGNHCVEMAYISNCPVENGCGSGDHFDIAHDKGWRKEAKKQGIIDTSPLNWDICEPHRGGGIGKNKIPPVFFVMSSDAIIKAIIGLILFLVFAGFIVPHVLYRMGHNTLVSVWIPNIDLVATVFSFRGGLFNSMFFRFLSSGNPSTLFGFWSKLIIEYFALLGLTLITAQMVWKRKRISRGMSYAIIMLLFSYLIPNALIEGIMQKIHTYLDHKPKIWLFIHSASRTLIDKTQISILGGFLAVAGFLLLERFLVNEFLYKIDKLSYFLVNKIWYSLGHKHKKRKK